MRDDARLYKRGRIWWGWVYDTAGERIDFSTRCRDKEAARIVYRQREAEAADPRHAAAARSTLGQALKLLIEERDQAAKAGRRAEATVKMHREKAGVLTRILESDERGEYVPLRLARLGADDVDRFIAARRAEWALPPRPLQLAPDGQVLAAARAGRHVKDATIAKELVTLRCALKLARRRGLWVGDPGAILPAGFSPAYKPKERRLSREQLRQLLGTLTEDHAARVAFMVATSADRGATERAERKDVSEDLDYVLVRGTKRATRWRTVPIVSVDQRTLLEYAVKYAQGPKEGLLFEGWQNVRRDLREGCARVGIDSCSPNDLRRTCLSWLRASGVAPHLLAPLAGHADSRMVERVYGRLQPSELAALIADQLPTGAAATAVHLQRTGRENDGSSGQPGLADAGSQSEVAPRRTPI